MSSANVNYINKPKPINGERHTLLSETELRIEIPQHTTAVLTLLSGSAEIFGSELTLSSQSTNKLTKQSHVITGHAKFAIFTWHGCTIDIDVETGKSLDISYTSDETACNIAYVNTHAQLEAMRDEALGSSLDFVNPNSNGDGQSQPPRVLVVGPRDSGKTSVVKVLTSYAVKLGRNPILVDLDVSQNLLSMPGTISASPMTIDSITPQSNASSSSMQTNNTNPLVFWYGSTDLSTNPDFYKSLLDKMGACIDARITSPHNNGMNISHLNSDNPIANPQENQTQDVVKTSGIIVNGYGWIEDMGYELMKHSIQALNINVVLVMGHDRLYSLLSTHYNKLREQKQKGSLGDIHSNNHASSAVPKVIKLPRSGGIVSRDSAFRRISRILSMKQYFYGEPIVPSSTYKDAMSNNSNTNPSIAGIISSSTTTANSSTSSSEGISVPTSSLVNQYSPSLLEINFSELTIYKISNVSLSASMLPVSSKQSSATVQLTHITDLSSNSIDVSSLQHCIMAVCHPVAVENYNKSLDESDLYMTGVTGFVVVEKVDMNREIISLLSPCMGTLASSTLLVADISWRE